MFKKGTVIIPAVDYIKQEICGIVLGKERVDKREGYYYIILWNYGIKDSWYEDYIIEHFKELK